MAITNRDTKWELKNSWFLFLAGIPFVNVIVLFTMSSRTAKAKWKRIGWVVLALTLVFMLASFFAGEIKYAYPDNLIEDAPGRPQIEDYLGVNYYDKYKGRPYPYKDEETGIVYEKYQDTPEYDQFENDDYEWKNTPEQKKIELERDIWNENWRSAQTGLEFVVFVVNAVVFFIVVADRGNYLRLLAANENKQQVAGAMATGFANASSGSRIPEQYRNQQGYAVSNQQPQAVANTGFVQQPPINNQGYAQQPYTQQAPIQPQPTQPTQSMFGVVPDNNQTPVQTGIDVNSAPAEVLATLPGITIIDGKKAVSYREANGGFRNIDEFYSCIQAKPHIIANIMNSVYVGAPVAKQPATKPSSPKRTIDI